MNKKGNWGVKSANVVMEQEKANNESSIVRVRIIETLDDQKFVDIRNWYNKQGEVGCPNMGKGIWLEMDLDMLNAVIAGLRDTIEIEGLDPNAGPEQLTLNLDS